MNDNSSQEVKNGLREALGQIGAGSSRLVDEALKGAGQYGRDSLDYCTRGHGVNLMDVVRRDPIIAIAGAFSVGFVAAKLLRRMSS